MRTRLTEEPCAYRADEHAQGECGVQAVHDPHAKGGFDSRRVGVDSDIQGAGGDTERQEEQDQDRHRARETR